MRGISKSGPFSTFFQVRQTYCRFPLEFHINSRVREINRILLLISRDAQKVSHFDRHFLKIQRFYRLRVILFRHLFTYLHLQCFNDLNNVEDTNSANFDVKLTAFSKACYFSCFMSWFWKRTQPLRELFLLPETYLRNASMSVALPVTSCLHLGQMHGLKPDLVIWSMLYATYF